MGKASKLQRQLRQNQLLKLFDGDFYQEKYIKGKYYIKQFNGNTKNWQVAEYTPSSFMKYKAYNESLKMNHDFNRLVDEE